MKSRIFVYAVIPLLLFGCSKSNPVCNPVTPDEPRSQLSSDCSGYSGNRTVWGFWEVSIPADRNSIDFIPDRNATMHLNTVRMLQDDPCTDCISAQNLKVLPGNILEVDFVLRHPFDGNLKLTGFDVRGIMMTGSDYSFPSTGRNIAWGDGLIRMLNPDGYTHLFNPTEFPETQPGPPALHYIPGHLAPEGDLSATLNPYVAYERDQPRRFFPPGTESGRTIQIQLPDGPLEFGYAVDACWDKVDGEVIDPLTDFPISANCHEAYRIDCRIGNGLEPGEISETDVNVEIYDHQGSGTVSSVFVEAPDLFTGEVELEYMGPVTGDSFLYSGSITNEFCVDQDYYPMLIRVIDTESDQNLGQVDAWQVATVPVQHNGGWARTWGGSFGEWVNDIAADAEGNACVVGRYNGAVDFDPGPDVVSYSSNNSFDIFLSKFDAYGELMWARVWDGPGMETPYGVDVDSMCNIYMLGNFDDEVDFDPGEGTDIRTPTGTSNFITKLDPDGNCLWTLTWGNEETLQAHDIAVDAPGNISYVGYFSSTVDLDPGPGIDEHTNESFYDNAYLTTLDSSGNYMYSLTWGGPELTSAFLVATTEYGERYISGYFGGLVDFDPGPGITELEPTVGDHVYVSGFDNQGNFKWAKNYGGPPECYPYDIDADNYGNVFIGGGFGGTIDFDPGPGVDEWTPVGGNDHYVTSYQSDGEYRWTRAWGSYSDDGFADIAASGNGGVHITDYCTGLIDFDPGPGENIINNWGSAFLTTFDSNGDHLWVRIWGQLVTLGLPVDTYSYGVIYAAGRFDTTGDFDPGDGVDEHTPVGGYDVYLSRFLEDGYW